MRKNAKKPNAKRSNGKKKHKGLRIGLFSVVVLFLLAACFGGEDDSKTTEAKKTAPVSSSTIATSSIAPTETETPTPTETETPTPTATSTPEPTPIATFDPSAIPDYSGQPYVVVNDNTPYFTDSDLTTRSFEKYSDLDSLGRCGAAYACVGKDIMPTGQRESIGSVTPTGWHTVKYNGIEGNYHPTMTWWRGLLDLSLVQEGVAAVLGTMPS